MVCGFSLKWYREATRGFATSATKNNTTSVVKEGQYFSTIRVYNFSTIRTIYQTQMVTPWESQARLYPLIV